MLSTFHCETSRQNCNPHNCDISSLPILCSSAKNHCTESLFRHVKDWPLAPAKKPSPKRHRQSRIRAESSGPPPTRCAATWMLPNPSSRPWPDLPEYTSDAFEECHAVLLKEEGADPEDRDEYTAENVFWVPQQAGGRTSRRTRSRSPLASSSTTPWSPLRQPALGTFLGHLR